MGQSPKDRRADGCLRVKRESNGFNAAARRGSVEGNPANTVNLSITRRNEGCGKVKRRSTNVWW